MRSVPRESGTVQARAAGGGAVARLGCRSRAGRSHVVDAGRSSVTQDVNSGLSTADLTAILITRLHADHAADLYNYVDLAAFGVHDVGDGVTQPVTVLGPCSAGLLPRTDRALPTVHPAGPVPGIAAFMESMRAADAHGHNLFIRDSGVPDPASLLTVREIHPAGRVGLLGAQHGADVLVHEVIDLSLCAEIGSSGALLDQLRDSHTDVTEVGGAAQQAGAATLARTHLVPALPSARTREQWRSEARQGFSGTVVVGGAPESLYLPP